MKPKYIKQNRSTTAFTSTHVVKNHYHTKDTQPASWSTKAFENRYVWGVYVYIDIPIQAQKGEVLLQRKKVLCIQMQKNTQYQSSTPYKLSYYTYIIATYSLERWIRTYNLNIVAMNALFHFIVTHKNETIAWIEKEELVHMNIDEKLDCLRYFLKYPHLKEINFYYWDMVLLQNYTTEYNTELKMLDFILHHRKEKSIRKALYTSYKIAIDSKKYNPHSDYIFSRTIKDPNLLVTLLSMDFTVKQNLLTDENYLEAMALIKFLKKYYTEKQISQLFIIDLPSKKQMNQYWEDILRMLQRNNAFLELEEHFFKNKLTIEALHDEIVRILRIADFSHLKNAVFTYEEHLLSMQGFHDDLIFKLPFSIEVLSLWSNILRNCMFSYAESIQCGESVIYGVFKEEKLLYALELSEGEVVQAKALANQNIPQVDMEKIEEWHNRYRENLEQFFEQTSKSKTPHRFAYNNLEYCVTM